MAEQARLNAPCSPCSGSGIIGRKPCKTCGGEGRVAGLNAPSGEVFVPQEELLRRAEVLVQSCYSALHDIAVLAGELDRPEYLLSLLYELRDLKSETRRCFATVEESVFPVMGEQTIEVAPYGEFKAHRGMKRSGWRHDQIIKRTVAQVADEFWGQPPAVFAEEVARAISEVVGFSAGKIRGLRARGLTPSEFCDEQPDGWKLELPRKVTDEDAGIFGPDVADEAA